ncbi:hypothetical protein A3Q56_05512 [Intoshia linei]|uniref:G-protein coupled receptors family 1 profile domain-containing protein n=1 Tax=Intoshia linei TaxID=1819745 RepID=A0A177AXN3_9BILA|nr:hypothetical protein A3Q56_05512 [Intoshia linei]
MLSISLYRLEAISKIKAYMSRICRFCEIYQSIVFIWSSSIIISLFSLIFFINYFLPIKTTHILLNYQFGNVTYSENQINAEYYKIVTNTCLSWYLPINMTYTIIVYIFIFYIPFFLIFTTHIISIYYLKKEMVNSENSLKKMKIYNLKGKRSGQHSYNINNMKVTSMTYEFKQARRILSAIDRLNSMYVNNRSRYVSRLTDHLFVNHLKGQRRYSSNLDIFCLPVIKVQKRVKPNSSIMFSSLFFIFSSLVYFPYYNVLLVWKLCEKCVNFTLVSHIELLRILINFNTIFGPLLFAITSKRFRRFFKLHIGM